MQPSACENCVEGVARRYDYLKRHYMRECRSLNNFQRQQVADAFLDHYLQLTKEAILKQAFIISQEEN